MEKQRLFKNNSRQPQWEDPLLLELEQGRARVEAEVALVSNLARVYLDLQRAEHPAAPVLP